MSFTLHNSTQLGFGRMLRAGLGVFDNPQFVPTVTNGALSLTLSTVTPGAYFTAAPTITITDRGGAVSAPPAVTATATAGVSGGLITGTTITAAGHFYTAAPTITVSVVPGSTNGALTAVLGNAGNVTAITIANAGTGYTTAPTLTFSNPVAVIQPTATAVLAGGYVYKILVGGTNTGYTVAPAVTFTGGGGTNASAIANVDLAAGEVYSYTVTNPGSGYTSPPTVVLTGGGSTAVATGTAVIASQLGNPTGVAGLGFTSVPLVSVSPLPTVSLAYAGAYGPIISAERPTTLGLKGSDEVVNWVWPTTILNPGTNRQSLSIPNTAKTPFIVTERAATSLTINLQYGLTWINE